MKNHKKGFAGVPVLIFAFLGLLVTSGFMYKNYQDIPLQKTIDENYLADATSTDETANWKTYRNENYKFQFKYPSEWIIKGDQFANQNYEVIGSIFVDGSTKYLTVKQREERNKNVKGEGVQTNVVKVDDIEVLKTYFEGTAQAPDGYEVYFIADEAGVVLNFSNIPFIDKMISSIELINSDLSNWKTYRNEEYGFEFKYPATYMDFYSDTSLASEFYKNYISHERSEPDNPRYGVLLLGIKELEGYFFDNQREGKTTYDDVHDICYYNESNGYSTSSKKVINGIPVCRISTGEACEGAFGYAVPIVKKQIVIEFMVTSALDCGSSVLNPEDIISELEFTN
jgi:hypothetical protein